MLKEKTNLKTIPFDFDLRDGRLHGVLQLGHHLGPQVLALSSKNGCTATGPEKHKNEIVKFLRIGAEGIFKVVLAYWFARKNLRRHGNIYNMYYY